MRRLLSLALVLVMCWSAVYMIVPTVDVSAVETGSAALAGERYTVDWTIPEIGNASVTGGTPSGAVDETAITGLSYEILGYVSPKYPDADATDKVYNSDGELISGGFELLDGTKASNHYLNDNWVGIYGNEKNAVLIDLGAYYTNISTVTLNMLSDPELGIFLPSKITVATSYDGVTFDYVGTPGRLSGNGIESGYYVPTEYQSVCYDVYYQANTLFKGQYILLVFEHEDGDDGFNRCWTFLSELSVSTNGAAVMPDFSGATAATTYDKPTGDIYEVNSALNTNYQILGAVGTGLYGDTDRVELTNGVDRGADPAVFDDYVSVTPTEGIAGVQIDLGMVTENITSFMVSGYGGGSSSYALPALLVYVSDDREAYYSLGLASASVSQNGSVYELSYSVANNKAFSARYISLVLATNDSTGGSLLLDEVMVITTNVKKEKDNVALTAKYKYLLNTASTSFNDDKWDGTTNNSVPALNEYSSGDLNDGISATGTFLDPAWVGYDYVSASGAYVDILFDLGDDVSGINSVSFKLLEYTNSSTVTDCSVPSSFTVFYSLTEDSFNTIASSTGAVGENGKLIVNSAAASRQIYYTYTAELNYVTAHYIMLRIPKENKKLFIDEININVGSVDPVETVKTHEVINYDTVSGVWLSCWNLSSLYMVQGTYQADEQTYRQRLNNYLTAMVQGGINTILIHTRSHGDIYYGDYTSDYASPASKRYVGSYTAVSTYDAFEIFVEEAHKVGLSVHAWINPMRMESAANLSTISDDYAMKQIYNGTYAGESHSDYCGLGSDGYYWLNIGYESVLQYIVDSALEVVNNYDIDGFVIDDYFYPAKATTSFDSECYKLHGDGESLGNWRRSNADRLVQALYKNVKNAKPDILVGFSVDEVLENYENSYNYSQMYADVKKWAQETWTDSDGKKYKYADYISPQFYGSTATAFAAATRTYEYNYKITGYLADWCGLSLVEGLKLVPSLGLSQNFEASVSTAYYNDNVILNQLVLMRNYLLDRNGRQYNPVNSAGRGINLVSGQILFDSGSLYNDYSVDVSASSSGGWRTNDALTEARSADIRNELTLYWQGELTPEP